MKFQIIFSKFIPIEDFLGIKIYRPIFHVHYKKILNIWSCINTIIKVFKNMAYHFIYTNMNPCHMRCMKNLCALKIHHFCMKVSNMYTLFFGHVIRMREILFKLNLCLWYYFWNIYKNYFSHLCRLNICIM